MTYSTRIGQEVAWTEFTMTDNKIVFQSGEYIREKFSALIVSASYRWTHAQTRKLLIWNNISHVLYPVRSLNSVSGSSGHVSQNLKLTAEGLTP